MGRPRIYNTAAERQRAYRQRKQRRLEFDAALAEEIEFRFASVHQAVLEAAQQGVPAAREIVSEARFADKLARRQDSPSPVAVMEEVARHFYQGIDLITRRK